MGKRGWSLVVVVLLVGVSVVLFDTRSAAAKVPNGFSDKRVTSVKSPTAMAFTPDKRMLISTQPGVLRMRKGGATSTSRVLNISRRICSNSERGMLGVAVDPNFSSNRYVYIYYTYKKHGVCPANKPTAPVNRVSRFVMSGDTIRRSSEKVLVDNIPSPNTNHNAGDIHFGKDGYLYISVGDGGRDYKGDSGSGGENDAARDKNILLGKILRVTRNGKIPSSNPYTGDNSARCGIPSANGRTSPGKNCRETFARGLRNPFRMGFDPDASRTRFFINDVGQKVWEEIDRGKKGADYGWNLCEGRHDNPDRPGSVNCRSKPYTPPIHEYKHTSGCSSITGAAFVPDGVWPTSYNKSYLFGDYVCGKIFKLTPKSGGGYSKTAFATGLGRGGPVAMTFGPLRQNALLHYLRGGRRRPDTRHLLQPEQPATDGQDQANRRRPELRTARQAIPVHRYRQQRPERRPAYLPVGLRRRFHVDGGHYFSRLFGRRKEDRHPHRAGRQRWLGQGYNRGLRRQHGAAGAEDRGSLEHHALQGGAGDNAPGLGHRR